MIFTITWNENPYTNVAKKFQFKFLKFLQDLGLLREARIQTEWDGVLSLYK